MSVMEKVKLALRRWPEPRLGERGISVPTHCLYPSNSVVKVTVEGGEDQFYVDDDGGALEELEIVKTAPAKISRQIAGIVRPLGLTVTGNGVIRAEGVSANDLEATIVLVANASKMAAEHLIDSVRPPRRNLRSAVERILEQEFKNRWTRDSRITGASNKTHKFDYVIELGGNRQLLLDIVMPEPSSINAAVVANLDVRQAASEQLEQRIIYDDQQSWTSADLALLKVGARAVPLSHLAQALDGLAA